MRATLSVQGLYNYRPDIFEGFRTPEGVDRQTTIDTILQDCAELEVVYADPDTMRRAVILWVNSEFDIWARMQATTQFKYDPITNYDRTEEWDETQSAQGESESQGKTSVVGYNGSDPVQADQVDSAASYNTSGSGKRKGRAFGNIGTMTTQQMIREEREISDFCVIKFIAESFKHNFCLLVY